MRNDFNLNIARDDGEVLIKGYVDNAKNVVITEPDIGSGGLSNAAFYVVITENPEDNWTADRTYSEIEEAFLNGQIIIFVTTVGQEFMSALATRDVIDSSYTAKFINPWIETGEIDATVIEGFAAASVTISENETYVIMANHSFI